MTITFAEQLSNVPTKVGATYDDHVPHPKIRHQCAPVLAAEHAVTDTSPEATKRKQCPPTQGINNTGVPPIPLATVTDVRGINRRTVTRVDGSSSEVISTYAHNRTVPSDAAV